MSSLKIFKYTDDDPEDEEDEDEVLTPEDEEEDVGCVVTVWEKADFTGWSAEFGVGDFGFTEFQAGGAVNDDVEAITVVGTDCTAEAWENQLDGEWGWHAEFKEGEYGGDDFTA